MTSLGNKDVLAADNITKILSLSIDNKELTVNPFDDHQIETLNFEAAIEALQSDWLTSGPIIQRFESEFASVTNSVHAVSVNSGTAALHAALYAAGIGTGRKNLRSSKAKDEVIVPAITFIATANAALYVGAKPVFADVDPATLLIDPADVLQKITPFTKAIVAMDYGGQPCNYTALRNIADQHNLILIADACHSLGASLNARPVGSLADFSCFSLHSLQPMAAGEGGVVTTDDTRAATTLRSFRNHGMDSEHHQRFRAINFENSMMDLGFDYRINDIQCVLAWSQLKKLAQITNQRRQIAQLYDEALAHIPGINPLVSRNRMHDAFYLYVIQCDEQQIGICRDDLVRSLRKRRIGANVHYRPVYQHPYYQDLMAGDLPFCPHAESAAEQVISLPISSTISEQKVHEVASTIADSISMGPAFKASA